jgi:hydrogenase small subunit
MRITRRNFLRMSAYAAAATGLTGFDLGRLSKAFAAGPPPVLWLEGLGDQGCIVSLANYFDGTAGIEGVLLNSIDLKFNPVLSGAAGEQAIDVAEAVYADYLSTPYVLVLTGSLTNLDGYCVVGENGSNGVMQLMETFNRWEDRAAWVIYAGACATYGGVNAIGGNITSNEANVFPPMHTNVATFKNTNYDYSKSLYLPGCPVHPDWVVLSIVHILTNAALPPRDSIGRPTSLLGTPVFANTVHSQCPRKTEHDAGNFAEQIGDPVKCLRSVGCRGKETYGDCPTRGWNSVGAYCNKPGINGLCIGCTQPSFSDVPFNREITDIS